jgi:hypothetical protein
MSYLPPRVDPRISPPGHSKPHGVRQPQHMPERLRQHPFDGPPPRLRRPPRELSPVIGEINPDPQDRVIDQRAAIQSRVS